MYKSELFLGKHYSLSKNNGIYHVFRSGKLKFHSRNKQDALNFYNVMMRKDYNVAQKALNNHIRG